MNYRKIIKSTRLRFAILNALWWVPDVPMVKLQYWIKLKRWPNLKNPVRFSEKIVHYKLYYRNPEMLPCVDKYKVREFVESRGCAEYLNTLYGVYKTADEIDFSKLPNRFVIKTTDGANCDNVLICRDKSKLDIRETVNMLNKWRHRRFYVASREWAYRGAKESLFIAEKYLENDEDPNNSIDDYKFFCYNGKALYIVYDTDRSTVHKRAIYDRNWNCLNIGSDQVKCEKIVKRPENLDEMIDVAEKLSAGFPFVRVDLYSISGKTVFGEMTFYPWSGGIYFDPDSFDFELGENLDINY